MASNEFASMLHGNGYKLAAVVVYTLLEWTLIILLLLNGLFSYLIAKFATFFGLAPPCAACSRIDRLFEPDRSRLSLADLLCDDHAAELSGLGFCRHHRRLAEASDMCEDCSSSRPRDETDRAAAMLSWMRRSEQGEKDLSCSCCNVVLENRVYSPYLFLKRSILGVREQYDDCHQEAERKNMEGRNLSSLAYTDTDDAENAAAPHKGCVAVIADEETEEEQARKEDDAAGVVDMELATTEVVELTLREEEVEEGSLVLSSDAYQTAPDASLDAVIGCPDDACSGDRLITVELIDSATVANPVVLSHRHVLVGEDYINGPMPNEHDNRAMENGDILKVPEALDSATKDDKIAKIISLYGRELSKALSFLVANGVAIDANFLLKDVEQHDPVTCAGCITENLDKLSDAERSEPNAKGRDTIKKNAICIVRSASDKEKELATATESTEICGAILGEENALVSPVMADLIGLTSLGQEALRQDSMILDDPSPFEKENVLISSRKMTRTTNENSSQDNEFKQCASTLDAELVDEQSLSSAVEMADLIDLSSHVQDRVQRDAVISDVTSTFDKVNALASSIEVNDIIELSSPGQAGLQQDVMAPDVGSSIEDVKELVDDMVMPHLVELESVEQDVQEPDAIVLIAKESDLPVDHRMTDFVEEYVSVLPGEVGELLTDHDIVLQEIPKAAFQNDVVQVEALILEKDINKQLHIDKDGILADGETNCKISIRSEICDQEHIKHANFSEQISTSDNGQDKGSVNYIENSEINESPELASGPDFSEVEEDRAPEIPTYVDDPNNSHKQFLLGRRESGTESLDGSIAGEIEGSDTLTTEQLKFALKSERKALHALYAELEEERSAAAIAANQTMAMITRLHEEKAAMQMEALQYQRMLEEQSEYDQEALHILNELIMKREKEKQELEKELEAYKKKVHLYEAKERRLIKEHKANGRTGASTASSAEDSDDLSSEFHERDECGHNIDATIPLKENIDKITQNTPNDVVLSSATNRDTSKHLTTLNKSLAGFEDERISILEQLKVLEEKLFTLEEDSCTMEFMEHLTDENGHMLNGDYQCLSDDLHDDLNGFSDDSNAKLHSAPTSKACRGKRLLPLFDAVDNENDSPYIKSELLTNAPESISNLGKAPKKLEIVEEVDNIYERLQTLEADREFLKHCISSLKKGDKGTQLLQDILEHLHDLRNVELQMRNAGDVLTS